MKSVPVIAEFSPFPAVFSASRLTFSARFVFVRLIDRVSCSTLPRSTDHAHAAAPAQLFHAAQKSAIRHHIIALSFHDHHKIAVPLHIEQYLRLALPLVEK